MGKEEYIKTKVNSLKRTLMEYKVFNEKGKYLTYFMKQFPVDALPCLVQKLSSKAEFDSIFYSIE